MSWTVPGEGTVIFLFTGLISGYNERKSYNSFALI